MKKYIFLQLKQYGLVLVMVLASFSLTRAQGFSPETEARLQQVLQTFQNDPSFVGGISAAIKVNNLASWKGATGFAARNVDAQNNLLPGGTPFTTTTLSRIYSVTKTFTAALTLELAKQGMLNLDEPVGTYIPFHLVNPTLNSSVTIRQLLVHESGYSDYISEMQFQIALAFQPTHIWTPYEVIYFVHQVAQPGSVRTYSSTNYIMLGAIIETATGKSIQQHFRERFFVPLGLQTMYVGVRESQPAGTVLASPHDNISAFNPVFQLTGQPTFPDAYTNISAFPADGIVSAAFTGGAIVSDATDLAAFGDALFTGQATSQSTLDSMLNSISSTPDAQGDYLGYGIWKSTKMSNMETFYGHDGNAPGYRSVMFYQPEKKLTLVVLTNFRGADIYAIARALYAALPDFVCGNDNKKETKVKLCVNESVICVDRNAADEFIERGAYLGDCETNISKSSIQDKPSVAMENFSVYPNPFSNQLRFSFKTEKAGKVQLKLFDMNGRLVSLVFNGQLQKETLQTVNFERKNLASGTYIVTLETPGGSGSQKVIKVQ